MFLVTPMHAHISARAVNEADFSTEKWCWDCAGGRAQSARVSESDGATAQAVCRPWVCSCVCDVGLGAVRWIVVGVGVEGGYCRMSSKCDRDMRESTVGMLSIRETPWSA